MKITIITLLMLTFAALPISAQTAVNPRNATWTPAPGDHSQLETYELDLIDSAGAVIQTLTFDATALVVDAAGEVTVSLNVQPHAFGVYTAEVRGCANGLCGPDSDPTGWIREPGKPGGLRLQ